MKLIKELGQQRHGSYRTKCAIYECGRCKKHITLPTKEHKRKTTNYCNSCAKIVRNESHKECGTRLYNIWKDMKKRCNNKKHKSYSYYGGDGATVCEEWNKYAPFRDWAKANGYTDELTIERDLSKSKEYNPSNCSWETRTTQSRTTRRIMSTNTSGYRGVSMDKNSGKYKAYVITTIDRNKKQYNLGTFDTALEAAVTRDKYIVDNGYEHTLNDVL